MQQVFRILLFSQQVADRGFKVPYIDAAGQPNFKLHPTAIIPSGFECAFVDNKLVPFTHTALLIPTPDINPGNPDIAHRVIDDVSSFCPDTRRMAVIPAYLGRSQHLASPPVVIDRDGNPVNHEIWKEIGYDPNNVDQMVPDEGRLLREPKGAAGPTPSDLTP